MKDYSAYNKFHITFVQIQVKHDNCVTILIFKPETYPELSRIFKIELFAKIVDGWKSLTIFKKSSILDARLGFEYASINYNIIVFGAKLKQKSGEEKN